MAIAKLDSPNVCLPCGVVGNEPQLFRFANDAAIMAYSNVREGPDCPAAAAVARNSPGEARSRDTLMGAGRTGRLPVRIFCSSAVPVTSHVRFFSFA